MKKSILFIIPSLGCGGAEKSLITLLSLLDYNKYDVDLMLFRREGFFLDQIPTWVTVFDAGDDYRNFDGDFLKGIRFFIKHGNIKLTYFRIRYMFALRKKESLKKNKFVWKYLSAALPKLEKSYDVSIAYLEGNSTYYCVDKTNAPNKIGYIHSDYSKIELNMEFSAEYFEKLNSVITVSMACAVSLIKSIPSVKGKTVVIENIVSAAEIKKLSVSAPVFVCDPDCVKILTVGRLAYEKGIDIAAEACELIVNKGYKICWYVIGSGEIKDDIKRFVTEKGLEKMFFLIGQHKNPYKYMAQCDIYVQPSRYEGKSIAVEEAKVLAKPIVVTNFTTVNDQIKNNINGLIAKIDAASISEKIESIINNPQLAKTLSGNLKLMDSCDNDELEKFCALINMK